ncbi:MAG: hypothetical protein Q9204_008312, partial [Flavoplaca sp. TL-2023a]
MNKYIFPGADASTPLGWFVDKLEGAGFEIKGIDTIGVHYSATLWRWYRNWMANREKVEAKYGKRWFRIWEYFLAYSTIISRQGSATCYQITMVKNINSTHRVEGIPSQFGLQGALAASKMDRAAYKAHNAAGGLAEKVKDVLRTDNDSFSLALTATYKMPGYAASEQAFLSLVKTLHKGKGKENVPTDIYSLAQSYGKVNGDSIAPLPLDVDEDAPWPDHRPTALGAQEEPLKTSPLEKIFADPIQPEQSPATYTVIGNNFAPETTAADIEAALSDDIGPMQRCRIVSENPVVVAEMVFTEKSRAENVIEAYDNKKADGYLLRLYMKPQHEQTTPSAASHKEVEAVQTKENTVTTKVQHAQQPTSPVLRGRGRNRYTAVNGSAEPASKIDSEAPRSQKGLDLAADMINVEDKKGSPMGFKEADPIALIDETKAREKDRPRMPPKPTSSKEIVESSQESKLGEPLPVDVLRRLAMIDSKKQSILDRIS